MSPDLDGDGPPPRRSTREDAEEPSWSAPERELLDAALAFYGAAEGVIDLGGSDGPQLRRDAAGFDAVRKAMAVLEQCVRRAHAAGVEQARIAELARIDDEMVELILRRDGAAPGSVQS